MRGFKRLAERFNIVAVAFHAGRAKGLETSNDRPQPGRLILRDLAFNLLVVGIVTTTIKLSSL